MAYIMAQYLLWRSGMNLSLEDDVVGMVTSAGGPKGATRYIETLVRNAWRDWRSGLDLLARHGWRTNDVLAACSALNGFTDMRPRGEMLALELQDIASPGENRDWGLDLDHWRMLVRELAADDDVAYALWTIVREFWTADEALKKRIAKLGSSAVKPVGA